MPAIYVPLPTEALTRLRDVADRELRDTRQQATYLILDGLRRLETREDATEPARLQTGVAAATAEAEPWAP